MVRDVGLAEDLAQEALVTALERWPETGIPENPGAWLMATAKNRAIDEFRRRQMLERKHEELRARSKWDRTGAWHGSDETRTRAARRDLRTKEADVVRR